MKTNYAILLAICAMAGAAFTDVAFGSTPPALRYDGAYSSTKHYVAGDVVVSGSDIYEAVSHSADGVTPGTNSSVWIPLTFTDPNGVLPLDNTAIGANALGANTVGTANTAIGYQAMVSNTNGIDNVAIGYNALNENTYCSYNTAVGATALQMDTVGNFNTAVGYATLSVDVAGYFNTADGYEALADNIDGVSNLACGSQALYKNTFGDFNMAGGMDALFYNTTGQGNTACGAYALFANTTGSNNIAIGGDAGSNLTTGSYNIDIGDNKDQFEPSYSTDDQPGESNTIRIGEVSTQTATYIAGISGQTVAAGAQPVYIDATGKLGTIVAPVSSSDKAGVRDEIAKLKESNDSLKATNSKLEAGFALQQQEIKSLTATLKQQVSLLQKVSAQVQLNSSAPQVVSNNR